MRVLKIDSDAEPDVSNTLQIRGLPTILLINDMSVIMRVEGALEANELLQLVDHYLFGGPPPQLGENRRERRPHAVTAARRKSGEGARPDTSARKDTSAAADSRRSTA